MGIVPYDTTPHPVISHPLCPCNFRAVLIHWMPSSTPPRPPWWRRCQGPSAKSWSGPFGILTYNLGYREREREISRDTSITMFTRDVTDVYIRISCVQGSVEYKGTEYTSCAIRDRTHLLQGPRLTTCTMKPSLSKYTWRYQSRWRHYTTKTMALGLQKECVDIDSMCFTHSRTKCAKLRQISFEAVCENVTVHHLWSRRVLNSRGHILQACEQTRENYKRLCPCSDVSKQTTNITWV